MTINFYFLHSQYSDGIPEKEIGDIATQVRRTLGDLAELPPHWGNDGKTRRRMTLKCENGLNIRTAQEISRMLQDANLGIPRMRNKTGYDAFEEDGAAIRLERNR